MESERVELYKSVVSEITKGLEQVKRVKVCCSNRDNEQEGVLERMLSSHEEALLILTGPAPQGQCQSGISSLSDPPGSSSSVCKVTESKDASSGLLKRKTRTDTYNVKIKASSELPPDDGYKWRKYGQKEILGFKYPRSYFRCYYRLHSSNNCWATKQVQRSDDGTTFEVTYKGRHTCHARAVASSEIIGEKQEQSLEATWKRV